MFKVDGKYYKNSSLAGMKLIKQGKKPIKGYVLRLSSNGFLSYVDEEDEEVYEDYEKAFNAAQTLLNDFLGVCPNPENDENMGLTIKIVDFDTHEILKHNNTYNSK